MKFTKEIIDERIQFERFQVLAICGSVLSVGILSDILYKAMYLKLPINTYLLELIIFLGAGLLFFILGIQKGFLLQTSSKSGKTILKFRAFISSIVFVTFFLISDLFTGDTEVLSKSHFGLTVIKFATLVLISWLVDVIIIRFANREQPE